MKDQREAFDNGVVQRRLLNEAKRLMVGVFLFFILGGALYAYWIFTTTVQPFFPAFKNAFVYMLLMAGAFVAILLFFFVRALVCMRAARRGAFSVEEDVLVEVEEKFDLWSFLIRFGYLFTKKDCYRYIFKFESGKKFVINSAEFEHTRIGAAAEFSMPGDRFFTVFYNSKPEKLIWLYSTKTHNYKN